MRHRALAALVALLAAVFALPASGASGGVQTAVSRYSFDGRVAGYMQTNGRIPLGPGAMFADVSVDATDPAHPMAFFGDVIDLSSTDAVRTYGAAGKQSLCSAPLSCHVANGVFSFSASYTAQSDGKHAMHLRYYIVTRGSHVVVRDQSLYHWTAAHHPGGLTMRTDDNATGAGASVGGDDIGAMTGVTAPGPAGGSVAILVPGCDVVGAGALTLDGGVSPPTALCPSDPVTDVAPGATTWSVTGADAGVSSNSSRLLVITR
jgi:hypothetical protein